MQTKLFKSASLWDLVEVIWIFWINIFNNGFKCFIHVIKLLKWWGERLKPWATLPHAQIYFNVKLYINYPDYLIDFTQFYMGYRDVGLLVKNKITPSRLGWNVRSDLINYRQLIKTRQLKSIQNHIFYLAVKFFFEKEKVFFEKV